MNKLLFAMRLPLLCCATIISAHAIAQPTISTLSSSHGYPGASLTITGTNFDATPANNLVQFGTVKAAVTSASTTSLTVTVPVSADYNYISVENMTTHLIAYSDQKFLPTFDTFTYRPDTIAFSSYVPFPVGISMSYVFIDDLDRDGKPDFMFAAGGGVSTMFYRNTSSVGSIVPTSLTLGFPMTTPYLFLQGMAVGDIDGDGKPDIASTDQLGNHIWLLRNISTPGTLDTSSFDHGTLLSDTSNAFFMSLGDLNGDGKPELVFSHTDFSLNHYIGIYPNTSTPGSFSFDPMVNVSSGMWGTPQQDIPYIADIDGDGKPDIVLEHSSYRVMSGPWMHDFHIYRNTSTGGSISFAAPVTFACDTFPGEMKIYDVDGDGKPDIILNNRNVNVLAIYRNTSTPGSITSASLAAPVKFPMNDNFTFDFGDLNGDCRPDLIIGWGDSQRVSVYPNVSTPGSITTASFAAPVNMHIHGTSWFVAARDIDGDGKPELICGVPNVGAAPDSIAIFRNLPILTPPTGLNNTMPQQCKVYPNPASNEVTIDWGATPSKDATVSITDLTGRTVYHTIAPNSGATTTVYLPPMSDGIYILSVATADAYFNERLEIKR